MKPPAIFQLGELEASNISEWGGLALREMHGDVSDRQF